VSPSVGPLARVPCWNPLGLHQGDLHTPNSFLFSSRRHIRVWILLRFNLSSNSVAVQRFVRPHLVIKIVWFHLLLLLVFLIALWYAHAYATRLASCVARSSRRIRELDNLLLRDLVKRQCTARLSTRRTTETITLPRTDEQPTQSCRIDVKAQTGWTAVWRSTTPSGIERTSLQASRDSCRNKNSKSWYF
jgi:hypothetical protein